MEVISDPDPSGIRSPWRTYRECLISAPSGASHLLVLQDDAMPCRNLVAACARLARPEPVVLFLGGAPIRIARECLTRGLRGERLVPWRLRGGDWLPVIAVLWPVGIAERFIEWSSTARLPGDPNPRSDDAVAGKWARVTRQEVWVTVPSLVQHPDTAPSLIGKKARAGRSAWRVAFDWIGDVDPLEIGWFDD